MGPIFPLRAALFCFSGRACSCFFVSPLLLWQSVRELLACEVRHLGDESGEENHGEKTTEGSPQRENRAAHKGNIGPNIGPQIGESRAL